MTIYEQFLSRLHQATKAKLITWSRNADGDYVSIGRVEVTIRQVVPLIAGATDAIGPQAFEVLVADVAFSAWDGSECCNLVRETLAEAFPEWASQGSRVAHKLKGAIALLE